MASEVSICNRALRVLGVAPITALGEDSKAGAWAQETYADARDALLAEYPGNFAIKRAALAAAVGGPAWGPTHLYPLPADALRVLAVEGEPEARVAPWQVEARAIATDAAAPLKLRYIARVTDPALFGPLFVEALAARLAAEGAFGFTGSTSREAQLAERYRELVANARRYDAQEGTAAGLVSGDWLESRL
jgi:hypothetical protein